MIFCIEDDTAIRELEIYTLQSAGFKAKGFENGAELFEALKAEIPQLIILDIMLPDEDGISILKKIRQSSRYGEIPVMLATAKGNEYDKVLGLDSGADDYIVKPFGMMELIARVKALFRRTSPAAAKKALLKLGAIQLDTVRHSVLVNGEEVTLTFKEFELLSLFMQSPGRVFTRDTLLSTIWGYDFDGETRTVDVHLRSLRQKLGAAAAQIETVRGVGYCIKE